MGRTLFLTGRPGVGKTTLIRTVAKALGERAGGFYTEEIRGPGGRQGFWLVTLHGQKAVMAHKNLREPGRRRVGRYGVDVNAIERVGVAALRRAMQDERIVVIDEIGKMELLCGPFKDAVLQAVGGPHTVIATAMAKPNPWVDGLKAMPQAETWQVTVENRDGMVQQAIKWLERQRGPVSSRGILAPHSADAN
jgi:nucleoside-triphosphatase